MRTNCRSSLILNFIIQVEVKIYLIDLIDCQIRDDNEKVNFQLCL